MCTLMDDGCPSSAFIVQPFQAMNQALPLFITPFGRNFRDYCRLYLKDALGDDDSKTNCLYEKVSDRWSVCVVANPTGVFKQVRHSIEVS